MTPPLRLAVVGMGKMGQAVVALAESRGFTVVATLGPAAMAGDVASALRGAEIAIEFTTPEAAEDNVRALIAAGCATVSGTTAWNDRVPDLADDVRRSGGAFLWSPNFSVGVNLFDRLVAEAGRLFAGVPGFDAHLIETHHTAKKDAPSGTARLLESSMRSTLGRIVPVTSVRVGSVPGTHEVVIDGAFETVRLEHVARDRRVFAEGALLAARWLHGRAGVFTMRDVLDPDRNGDT